MMQTRMIEPIMSLAFSMQANPGVYALLVGSGISRSARIPTGWEVVLDMCRKLALLEKENCGTDPASWYNNKYGKDPDYSDLLDAIGKSATERQQLLRSYFEPSEEEREQGLMQPTQAHRSIANLVASGHCRVILTTNFDKLLERAIEDEGIAPVVLSTPDSIEGALPLVHQRCCVVKLHGDYLDTRIKNTPSELAKYDDRINRLLDEILDCFGLVICGWSAQWDAALRAAIERCSSHRFTTYWASRGKVTEEADRLVQQRTGELVPIDDADSFFGRLAELVLALADSKKQHPASVEAVVAVTKRYLSGPQHSIKLEDFVIDETELAHSEIESYSEHVLQSKPEVGDVYATYQDLVERLQGIVVHGVAYGSSQHDALWVRAIQRIARYEKQSGLLLIPGIRHYPVLLLLYSGGIAAIARHRHQSLRVILNKPSMRVNGQLYPLLSRIRLGEIYKITKSIPEYHQRRVPLSDLLVSVLREPLRHIIPDDADFDDVFDRFEILLALEYANMRYEQIDAKGEYWFPLGRYCWKATEWGDKDFFNRIRCELEDAGNDWPPVKAGMMNGSIERARELIGGIERFVATLRMW